MKDIGSERPNVLYLDGPWEVYIFENARKPGGFSSKGASVEAFNSPLLEGIIIVFMLLAGANFALHYRLLWQRDPRPLFRNSELKLYLGIVALFTALVTLNLRFTLFDSLSHAFRKAAFQVVSIMTTTGFTKANFDAWPPFSKGLLFLLMFVGGSAGSTGGSIKVIRWLIVLKHGHRELVRLLQPRAILPLRLGMEVVKESVVLKVLGFIVLYFLVFVLGWLGMAALGLDDVSAASSVAATLGNVGPGLGIVGPLHSYANLPVMGKLLLSLMMLVGRLEIYTVLVLFMPGLWRFKMKSGCHAKDAVCESGTGHQCYYIGLTEGQQ